MFKEYTIVEQMMMARTHLGAIGGIGVNTGITGLTATMTGGCGTIDGGGGAGFGGIIGGI